MHVGVCRFTLLIPGSHTLKEKRSVLRRLKDRVRERAGVELDEVGDAVDTWQRADLAFSVVARERDHAEAAIDRVLRAVAGIAGGVDGAQVAAAKREVMAFGEDWFADAAAQGRAWAEKAGEGDGDDDRSWLPAAWLADEVPGGER